MNDYDLSDRRGGLEGRGVAIRVPRPSSATSENSSYSPNCDEEPGNHEEDCPCPPEPEGLSLCTLIIGTCYVSVTRFLAACFCATDTGLALGVSIPFARFG